MPSVEKALAEKFNIKKFEVTAGTFTKTPGEGKNTYTPNAAGGAIRITEGDGTIQNHTGLDVDAEFVVHDTGHVEVNVP